MHLSENGQNYFCFFTVQSILLLTCETNLRKTLEKEHSQNCLSVLTNLPVVLDAPYESEPSTVSAAELVRRNTADISPRTKSFDFSFIFSSTTFYIMLICFCQRQIAKIIPKSLLALQEFGQLPPVAFNEATLQTSTYHDNL